MKILVIGSGGREHALVRACLASPLAGEVIAAPGNGGIAADVVCHELDTDDIPATVALAKAQQVDFVIVGPENPLSQGLVDALEQAGITAYGPCREGARLEASKAHAKDFMARHGIPTASARTFNDLSKALSYLQNISYPAVIKADGLAAGKGVVVVENFEQAEIAAGDMLVRNHLGVSGQRIVVEEFMHGEEASIMLMVSGENYVQLPPSQDHKRAGEGDTGPNTGGMGAYAPAAVVTPEVARQVAENIIRPTLAGLKADGIDYRGTLYIGIMVTPAGPKVVEYNVRFGDPECQILLPLLAQDPLAIMLACARGTLKPEEIRIKKEYAMIVVMAAKGYPASYTKGDPIVLPGELAPNTAILHAGTRIDKSGTLVSAGGRVLGIMATAPTLQQAADDAYQLCGRIKWNNGWYRRDIGHRQLQRT